MLKIIGEPQLVHDGKKPVIPVGNNAQPQPLRFQGLQDGDRIVKQSPAFRAREEIIEFLEESARNPSNVSQILRTRRGRSMRTTNRAQFSRWSVPPGTSCRCAHASSHERPFQSVRHPPGPHAAAATRAYTSPTEGRGGKRSPRIKKNNFSFRIVRLILDPRLP